MERGEQVTRWRILKDTVVNEQKSNIYTAISQPKGHTVKRGATDFSQQMKEHLLDALYK